MVNYKNINLYFIIILLLSSIACKPTAKKVCNYNYSKVVEVDVLFYKMKLKISSIDSLDDFEVIDDGVANVSIYNKAKIKREFNPITISISAISLLTESNWNSVKQKEDNFNYDEFYDKVIFQGSYGLESSQNQYLNTCFSEGFCIYVDYFIEIDGEKYQHFESCPPKVEIIEFIPTESYSFHYDRQIFRHDHPKELNFFKYKDSIEYKVSLEELKKIKYQDTIE